MKEEKTPPAPVAGQEPPRETARAMEMTWEIAREKAREELREQLQELEALRAEKRERIQQERATAALSAAGVPQEFAVLLSGGDEAETDGRVAQFCRIYQAALARDVSRRLPETAPAITADPPESKIAWGVKRLD